MNYNFKDIGKRIKNERQQANLNQDNFIEELNLTVSSRQTISKWENGCNIPPLDDLLKMCEKFNCELGYLLCEHNCKTRTTTDIQEITGLSETAISIFSTIKAYHLDDILVTLSHILEHKEFIDLLRSIHLHIVNFNKNQLRLAPEEVETLSKTLNCSNDESRKYLEASSKALLQSQFMKIIETL